MVPKTPTQQLKPLITSSHWDLLVSYLTVERENLVTQLCKCEIAKVGELQGQIRSLDRLLSLKQNLKAEEESTRR